MRNRLAEGFREAPWLMAAVALYLCLSAVEVARLVLLSDPIDAHDTGFSSWESVALPGTEARLFLRWSSPNSTLQRPIGGPVLGLTVYRPPEAEDLVGVTFEIGGQPLDAYAVGAGVYTFHYYLPAILPELWAQARERLADRARREAARASGGWLARWQELQPWRLPAPPPSVQIGVTVTPDAPDAGSGHLSGAAEGDRPGRQGATWPRPWVGMATELWLEELAPTGSGLHAEGTDTDGRRVRWTRLWASQPLNAEGTQGSLRVRAGHPDIVPNPVRVRLFWDGQPSGGVSLTNYDWTWVPFTVPAEAASGVLTITVDRTWSPRRAGMSADRRELGVLVGGLRWR